MVLFTVVALMMAMLVTSVAPAFARQEFENTTTVCKGGSGGKGGGGGTHYDADQQSGDVFVVGGAGGGTGGGTEGTARATFTAALLFATAGASPEARANGK